MDKLNGSETKVAELTNYVNNLQETLAEEETVIKEIDLEQIQCTHPAVPIDGQSISENDLVA